VQMRLEIKELQSKLGITALYVTHDQVEAMTMADRMIVMNDGIAEQIGTPLDVYEHPQTLFAAQFIGSPAMNVMDAKMTGKKATLANGAVLSCKTGCEGEVVIGIRPEHLIKDPKGPIKLDVIFNEPLGANTLLHGRLKGEKNAFTASLPGIHPTSQKAETIAFSMLPENLHVFDKKTGSRLF
jgi:sn-glycerol 3-phosphate transport system ATP-binding protein